MQFCICLGPYCLITDMISGINLLINLTEHKEYVAI